MALAASIEARRASLASLSVVAQVQASLLPPQASAQPQGLTLSSTLVVQQLDAAGNDNGERAQEPAAIPAINTVTGFGTAAPMLQIQNGGMQLPLVATSIK